ncbi:vanillate O-demethylase ferredoxin subunit [Sphingobium sp. AP50]|uniref:PDR/VanB family oxidoreductase n=1 Tax=Sphingobium sp. AP50 TaxID=1884369 RepID=UPI0008CA97B4|nr:PDR/VanB family oxidoreductase [Sphingobium sp. AP50]SEK06231.1 vanillate O-demethylase ferredoxin subunit [Sphingobium sp. AP50]
MSVQLDMIVTVYEPLAGDVWIIDLERHDGAALPEFEAGAHVDLFIGPEMVRPYSLCNSPAERHRYQFGILKDPISRGGSDLICTQWGVGMPVRASFPRNLFPLKEDAAHSILIGGGIGITPLIAMAHRLAALGRSFELHYCVRDQGKAAFQTKIADSIFAANARVHFSAERRFCLADDVGHPLDNQTHLYVCGPTGFMEQVIDDAYASGWGESQVHSEQFTAETDLTGAPFTVQLADGKSFEVPGGRSIASCLIDAGYDIEISCEQGICGTCIADVLEGLPDHRDHYLTEDERNSNQLITMCCSRSLSKTLILDFQ